MRDFEELQIGQTAQKTTAITSDLIAKFAVLTGDVNQVHLDDEYARDTFFGRRVAHGMISASLIAALIGSELPGAGSIYLSQNLEFKAPVFPGDEVTVALEILEKDQASKKVRLRTLARNQEDKVVIDGMAWVLLRPPRPSLSRK
ncbi:MAG: MaoC family dehydratase [Deltaproteobacteria bacterium]|nr:MaoC family dehydratase [Deltaproteobacteria bacterium]